MSLKKKRILIVDDNPSIHDDFRKVLVPKPSIEVSSEVLELESDLFDEPVEQQSQSTAILQNYQVDDAFQGEEALEMVDRAANEGFPYSLIFMDVRMPPGIDGIQTTSKIWSKHKNIEVIICTAYSDYSWDQIITELGSTSHLLFLKKPFDTITVRQMALSLTTKWDKERESESNLKHLESEVKKRTEQLENMISNLEKIREQSEKSIYSKSVFLSNISHEIKTPLNGILGITDLLLNTDLDEEQKNFTDSIKKTSDSLLLLLNNVLDFTKIETGKTALFNIDFYLRAAIENVTDLIALKCAEKNLDLVVQTHFNVPDALIGDPHRLRQIFLNLCTNAVKQTKKGEISVKIYINEDKSDDKNVNLQFEIEDTGEGYSASELEQLFAKNIHDSAITKNHSGLQLRYSISRELIKLMGGDIGIRSKKDKGSVIWFNSNFEYKNTRPFFFTSQNKSLAGINCLVLGDNPTSRKVISLHVKKWGGSCGESTTKENAVDKLQSSLTIKPYDILIIDLKSSDIKDYIIVSTYIKKFANLKGIHLVCLTSTAVRGDAAILQENGYSGFLTKPIKHSHLFNCLLMIRESYKEDNALTHSKIITKYFIDEFAPDRYRFLICSENTAICKAVAKTLNQLKINCDIANDIEQLNLAVNERRYDAIFMDLSLVDKTLSEMVKKIKEGQNNRARIFIINESSDEDQNKLIGEVSGISGILRTPNAFDAIDRLLNETFVENN